MKFTAYIAKTVDRLPRGNVFTYEDFTKEVKSKEVNRREVENSATGERR